MSPCKLQVPEHVRFFVYFVEILVSEIIVMTKTYGKVTMIYIFVKTFSLKLIMIPCTFCCGECTRL